MTADWPVIDLFSGCGGMSCGFARRPPFRLIAAVDREVGKPGCGSGTLDCNGTYEANIGTRPFDRDLFELTPEALLDDIAAATGRRLGPGELAVLACCPPCTDFSRTKPGNHSVDSPKNSLVVRCADFVEMLRPEFVVVENARELIRGHHVHHYETFVRRLEATGYRVQGGIRFLSRYGLPQIRERALVVAARDVPVRTLDELWEGLRPAPQALTVRHAIGRLARPQVAAGAPNPADPMHEAPGFESELLLRRIRATPADGGSWFDIADRALLAPSMSRRLARGAIGSHPDVYGRLAWDRPAVTIKRECAHVGNGRYVHPEQHRLLTVRETALLQGFPDDYVFPSRSVSNRYRHVGDAVPPLVSYQLSALVAWMKTGVRPPPEQWILPGTSLHRDDLLPCAPGDAPPEKRARRRRTGAPSPQPSGIAGDFRRSPTAG